MQQSRHPWALHHLDSTSTASAPCPPPPRPLPCSLIWALVHSPVGGHVQRGLDLALAALSVPRSPDSDRELRYFSAGG
jgi:hypothetical protein